MPVLGKNVKLVIFSFFSTNELFCKISKLNKATRQHLTEKKECLILNLDCLNLLAPGKIMGFDESYLINFAPMINLTLKCEGQA
jgi:hypothetical protein